MTLDILKYFKTTMVIIFFFAYQSLMLMFLNFLGINTSSLSNTSLTGLLFIIDLIEITIFFLIYYNEMIRDIKDFRYNFKKYIKFALKWCAIGLAIMYLSNIILYFIVNTGASNEEIVQEQIKQLPFYMLISTSITAPFTEEVVFRKSIRDIFTNKYLYIVASFLLFGGVHVLSSNSLLELLYIIPYGTFGAIFAYMYYKTNNIYTSMFIHFIHNFLIVILSIIQIFLGV